MKTKYILGAAAMMIAASLGSCSEEKFAPEGEGKVYLAANVNTDVKVFSRAADEDKLGESCIIWLSNEKGVVYKYQGINTLPAEGIRLLSGNYKVEAWAGEASPASFDKRWFEGSKEFELLAGQTQRVTVSCRIANVVTSVKYSPEIDEILSDYTLTVSHNRGELTFVGRDDRKGYFRMPPESTDLAWTLKGKQADGSEFVKTGVIENVQQAYEYVINVNYKGSEQTEIGGANLSVVVDETAVEVNDVITIAVAPSVEGYDFDLNKELSGEKGSIGRKSVMVKASDELQSVVLDCAEFVSLLGLSGSDFDILNCSQSILQKVNDAGINAIYTPDPETETSMMKINFEEAFTSLFENGSYSISVTATDKAGKTTTGILRIRISDAPVETAAIRGSDITRTSAVLRGTVLKDGVENVSFNYRAYGDQQWQTVEGSIEGGASVKGAAFTAELTGLTPGTTYEYAAVSGDFTAATRSFTTEALPQLPNSGMEDWQDGSPMLIYASDASMFWDSGNHGSATMRKNVTTYDTSIFHSGSRSAKLQSQFVGIGSIGKFAAGNMFVGEYLKTNGTNGVLGFGRPFTETPKALKVWVKYTPGTIQWADSDAPADVVKGEMDKGIIYTALMDDYTEEYEGKRYPVIINTQTKQLFNKESEHIIAYGEHVFTAATEGDGMIQITIPFEYFREGVTPSYIVLTASASKAGDYFAGGNSVMYLDDFELVY